MVLHPYYKCIESPKVFIGMIVYFWANLKQSCKFELQKNVEEFTGVQRRNQKQLEGDHTGSTEWNRHLKQQNLCRVEG
jgi:hypothetical protein